MVESTCFTRGELRDYLLGELSEEVSLEVAEHVEECRECEATVSQLDLESDTMIEALRAPVDRHEEASVYRLAAKRAQAFWKDRQVLPSVGQEDGSSAEMIRLRDYELLEPMARGGMGTVYRARHVRLNRQVAIKVLPSRWLRDPGVIARFEREMQAVGSLTHEAIVQATDGGEVDGVHFLVMELIDGLDGRALVQFLGPLSVPDACEIARQAAHGMAHVHERGIVHRDLKPSNLMVTRSGEVKVLDLGLARAIGAQLAEDELTTVGQLMGTLDYMAPEQLENSHGVDERADIYSLGATLYKLLASQPPHSVEPREPIVSKLRRISTDPPVPLQEQCPDAPAELCSLVDRMLARDIHARPESMQEVADSLRSFTESSDLASCVDDAQKRKEQAERQGACQASLLPSPSEDLAKLQVSGGEPKPASERGRGGGWFKWVVLVLIGFAPAIVLGVIVTLQTTAGRLVIETATPDVEIRVLKAGKPYKQLTLQHKANSLRLGAGQYEIEIVGDADRLDIENGTYTLRSGETWLAKIVHRPDERGSAPTMSPDDPVPAGGPTYEGKNLDQWLALLKHERSAPRLQEACQAFEKLVSEDRQHDVVTALLPSLRHHGLGRGDASESFGGAVMALFARLQQAVVMKGMTTELGQRDATSTQWILYYLTNGYRRFSGGSHVQPTELLLEQIDQIAAEKGSKSRVDAFEVLSRIAPDELFSRRFVTTLSDTDVDLQLYAAEQLVAKNSHVPEVVKTLRKIVSGGELEHRARAAWILGDAGPAAKPALSELTAIVEDPDEMVSRKQAHTWRMPNGSLIHSSLKDAAIRALAKIGDESVVPLLLAEWKRRNERGRSKASTTPSWESEVQISWANTYTTGWVEDAIETLLGVRPEGTLETEFGRETYWTYKGNAPAGVYALVFAKSRPYAWDELYEAAVHLADYTGPTQKADILKRIRDGHEAASSEQIAVQVKLLELFAEMDGIDRLLEPMCVRWQNYASEGFARRQPKLRGEAVKAYHDCAVRLVRARDNWKEEVLPDLLKLADIQLWSADERWSAGVLLLDLLSDIDDAQQVEAVVHVLKIVAAGHKEHFEEYREELEKWFNRPENRAAVRGQLDFESWLMIALGMFRMELDDEQLKKDLLEQFADPITDRELVLMEVLRGLDDRPELAQLAIELLEAPVLDTVRAAAEIKVSQRAQLMLRAFKDVDVRHRDQFVPWLQKMVTQGKHLESNAATTVLKSVWKVPAAEK